MLQNDEFLEQIGYLQRANRFWKGLALSLAAALALFLLLGTGLGFSLYFHAQDQQRQIEAAMMEAHQQQDIARRQAVIAAEEAAKRARQAEEAAKGARKEVEKLKAQP
jgi:hypothetical protein